MLGVAGVLAAVVLALVFLWAAVAKLTDFAGTRIAVTEFGSPERLVSPIAIAVPLAELAVAILLVGGPTRALGGAGALGLLGLFSAAIAVSLARGRAPDCHCFGQLRAAPTSWRTLVRNGLLAGLAISAFAAGAAGETPSAVRWIGGIGATGALAIGAGVAMTAFAIAGVSLMRSYGRVLLRLDAMERRLAEAGLAPDGEAAHEEVGLAPGTPAPTFSAVDSTGAAVSLAHLLAPELPVLLLFTSAACGPCQELMPAVAGWQREQADQLTIAVANGGDRGAAIAEAEKHGLERVLVDHDLALYEAYGANGTPSAVLISATGRLASWVASGAGPIEALVDGVQTAQWAAAPDGLPVGSPAPDLDLRGLDGERIALGDPRGGETLVLFWNPDCGFCRDMHADLLEWETQASSDGPRMLIVSSGDELSTRAERFASTVALDPDFTSGERFGAGGTPMAVLVDPQGRIASPVVAGAEAVLVLAGRDRSPDATQGAHRLAHGTAEEAEV
jgi:peroxiredoxin